MTVKETESVKAICIKLSKVTPYTLLLLGVSSSFLHLSLIEDDPTNIY
jgi:hypothetical protein